MPLPKRPRDPIARAKLVMDMLTGERPNDKEQVLASDPEQPTGPAKAAKARARQPDGGAAIRSGT